MATTKTPAEATFFDRLKDINANLGKSNIKGKPYANVVERVKGFWALYENGRIVTEILEHDGKRVTFRAKVYNGDALIATGTASEVQGGTGVNSTSYIENCETSAVGRALGFAGIGDVNIASAEEVALAIAQQPAPAPAPASKAKAAPAPTPGDELLAVAKPSPKEWKQLYNLAATECGANKETIDKSVKEMYGCDPKDLTVDKFKEFYGKIDHRAKKMKAEREAAEAAPVEE
jgi:hypothetical protein